MIFFKLQNDSETTKLQVSYLEQDQVLSSNVQSLETSLLGRFLFYWSSCQVAKSSRCAHGRESLCWWRIDTWFLNFSQYRQFRWHYDRGYCTGQGEVYTGDSRSRCHDERVPHIWTTQWPLFNGKFIMFMAFLKLVSEGLIYRLHRLSCNIVKI